ncbi:MAG: hypothetical protein ASARMPREDX12_007715 [Alectoria sarmentosa]|nr:MAG: hypothetical protein ASARMPREDX12_007715 [Alectoria sarmentosa]
MAPKKTKGEKMDLGTFLTDSTLGSWADEMEDMPMPSGENSRHILGGIQGNRGGYSVREQLPLPTKPPYTVHLGNMSFDATEGDITDFFSGCEVTSVRIVEDKLERKPKGFGYAEFATLDGLKKALDANNTQFQGRNIRVSVAEPQKDRPDAREFGDWTRKGPLADVPGQRRVPERGGFGSGRGGFDNASEAGSDRGDRGGRRAGYEQGDGKVRDFGNWDRKGPLTPTLPTGPAARSFDRPVSRDGPPIRRNSPAWGEGRSQDGSRPPRREFVERPPVERAPTAAEQDSQWRTKMRPDAPPAPPVQPVQAAKSPAIPNRELSTPPSPAGAPAAPTTRPKLNLAKRTVSEAPSEANSSDAAPAADSKASPFGAAKPIDTATREKEVEEKRQIALREKKEADEKARTDKKATEDKAREEKKAREAEQANKAEQAPAWKKRSPPEKVNGQEQKKANGQAQETENGASAPPPGRSYEILRRTANEDSSAADEEAEEAEAAEENGLVTEDKAIKPKEIVQDIQDGGAQTNGSSAAGTPDPSADALEGDGWSTVSKPEKKRKNGNQAARAIAS